MSYALLTNEQPLFIDSESRGVAFVREMPAPTPGWKSRAEWERLARGLAAVVCRPMSPRDVVRAGREALHVDHGTVRHALATADGWLLRFDRRQGLWCRTGVAL